MLRGTRLKGNYRSNYKLKKLLTYKNVANVFALKRIKGGFALPNTAL